MNDADHLDEELQELLDGRLDAEAQARVEAHLAVCGDCRRAWVSLRRTRDALRGLAPRDVPAEVADALRAALDREGQEERKAREPAPLGAAPARLFNWRPVLTYSLLTAAAVILLVVYFNRPDLPSAVARDSERYKAGDLTLEIQDGRAETVDAFLARRVPFPPRVFDLGMMNYALVGGRVHTLGGGPSAFFVYRGEDGRILVCQMYEGSVGDLPSGAERREHNGITFHVYRRGAQTLVFWQEGAVTCVLASDIAAEDVIQLAFAKAMLPARQ